MRASTRTPTSGSGAQGGFHTTPVLYDPTRPGRATRSYQVTLQVLCGKKPGKLADPHDIALNVPPGTSVTLVATARSGRADRRRLPAARRSSSRAASTRPSRTRSRRRQWQASGTAFGTFRQRHWSRSRYCMASPKRKPLLTEVSVVGGDPARPGASHDDAGLPEQSPAGLHRLRHQPEAARCSSPTESSTPTTPSPRPPTTRASPRATLTAIGYCLKEKVIGGSLKKFTKKVGDLDSNQSTNKQDQDGNPNG